MIKKSIILSIAAVIILGTTSLNAKPEDKVLATVNGKNITKTDVTIALKNQKINFETLEKDQQKQLLKQIIQKTLLSSKAMKSDVIESKFYKETLESAIKNIKEELALQVWMQKLSTTIKINEKDVSEFYEKNKFRFEQPMELKASHILVKTEQEAMSIINDLKLSKSLKKDFTEIAKTKSTGPSGKNGGELGWFTLDKMVPEFSTAAKSLSKNAITQKPVKTQFGFHVIYLDDKKPKAAISLAKASSQIKGLLKQEKFSKKITNIVNEETSKATIVYK